jgi:cupin 2 domain-containing protein
MSLAGNLFADLPADMAQEQFSALLRAACVRIERIVSHGQASPPGFWYDQDWAQ